MTTCSGMGMFGMVWLDVQRRKQRQGDAPEEVIDELRDPADVFFHSYFKPRTAWVTL